jgi:ParB family chromosome partitioning protein
VKLRKVKPSLIKWPEERVTSVFDEETRQLLTALIKELGLISPILVQEIDGEIVGVDGFHRCEDCIKLGDAPVDVAVIEGNMVDLLCRNLVMDHARGKHKPSQMIRLLKILYEKYELDPDKIKENTGLPRDYIEKLLKIGTGSSVVLEYCDEQWMGVGKAYEISRLPYAVQQEELVEKLKAWRWPVKEVKEMVDNILKEMKATAEAGPSTVAAAPRPIVIYHCEACKVETELRYLRSVMVCPNCFGEVWRLGKVRAAPEEKARDNGGGD